MLVRSIRNEALGVMGQTPALLSDGTLSNQLSLRGFLGLPKSDAFPAAIIINEFNASIFQRSAQCGFICKCHGDFALNNLRPPDGRHSNF
jgi:hypothetical protein